MQRAIVAEESSLAPQASGASKNGASSTPSVPPKPAAPGLAAPVAPRPPERATPSPLALLPLPPQPPASPSPPTMILRTDNRFHVAMLGASLAIVAALVAMFPRGTLWMLAGTVRAVSPTAWLVVAMAGLMVSVMLHEGAHAAVFRATGTPVSFGVLVRWRVVPLGAYCRPRGPVPHRAMVASLLAPQVVVPAVLLPIGAAVGQLPWAVLFCAANVIGGVGDGTFLAAILMRPAAAYLDIDEGLAAAPAAAP